MYGRFVADISLEMINVHSETDHENLSIHCVTPFTDLVDLLIGK